MAKQYWLMKSEPYVYSIEDLEKDGSTCWEGVRNYKARNNMRSMKTGDEVLYYHSNAKPPGVVGIARVCKEAYPDHYAFDESSDYFDPKSSPDLSQRSRTWMSHSGYPRSSQTRSWPIWSSSDTGVFRYSP